MKTISLILEARLGELAEWKFQPDICKPFRTQDKPGGFSIEIYPNSVTTGLPCLIDLRLAV